MNSIPFSETRSHLTEVVNNITYKGKRFVITKNGKQVAVFIPVEDLAFLEELGYTVNLKAAKIAKTLQKEKTILWKESKKNLYRLIFLAGRFIISSFVKHSNTIFRPV